MGCHQAARLVIEEQPGALARRQWFAVDGDDIVGGDIERRRVDDTAVDGDAALHNPRLGVAARGQPRPRNHLGDALAGFLFARRPRRTPFVGNPFAVSATAAESRTLGEDPAVILIVAPRPIGMAVAARMLLPCRASLGSLSRTVEFQAILARAVEFARFAKWAIAAGTVLARMRETWTRFATPIVPWLVVAGLVEFPRAVARPGIAADMIG